MDYLAALEELSKKIIALRDNIHDVVEGEDSDDLYPPDADILLGWVAELNDIMDLSGDIEQAIRR
jgi:hypothetical protein